MAATRLGCVHATNFPFVCGKSEYATNCGILQGGQHGFQLDKVIGSYCVVFPDPVSPTITMIWCSLNCSETLAQGDPRSRKVAPWRRVDPIPKGSRAQTLLQEAHIVILTIL
jgi:hypothetical protein